MAAVLQGWQRSVSHSVTQADVPPASFFTCCNEVKPTRVFWRFFFFFFFTANAFPRTTVHTVYQHFFFQIKRDFSAYTRDSKDSGRKRVSFQMEYQYVRKTGATGRCGAGQQTRSQVICCRSTPTSFMVMAAISALFAATQHPVGWRVSTNTIKKQNDHILLYTITCCTFLLVCHTFLDTFAKICQQ